MWCPKAVCHRCHLQWKHNVVPPAQPQPLQQPMNMPDNNPVQPARQVLPPAYQDYRLHANPGQPAPIPPMAGESTSIQASI